MLVTCTVTFSQLDEAKHLGCIVTMLQGHWLSCFHPIGQVRANHVPIKKDCKSVSNKKS